MAEVTEAAYDDIAAYIVANWTRIQLLDPGGVVLLSLTTSDPRVEWSDVSRNPIEIAISLSGADADTVGKTFAQSVIYRTDDADHSDPLSSENFSPFTFQADDSLVIRHKVQIPEII